MYKFIILLPFLLGCLSKTDNNTYKKLLEYEGRYEYIGGATLDIVASQKDTILYAVIDKSKYPLTYVNKDSF